MLRHAPTTQWAIGVVPLPPRTDSTWTLRVKYEAKAEPQLMLGIVEEGNLSGREEAHVTIQRAIWTLF